MPRMPKGMFRRKRKDGTLGDSWYTRVVVPGREHRKLVCLGPDGEKAKAKFYRLRSGDVPLSSLTLGQWADQWLKTKAREKRCARYHADTEARIKNYIKPALEHVPLSHLDGRAGMKRLDDFKESLTTDLGRYETKRLELKPETVRHILSDLRAILGRAEQLGMIERSPVKFYSHDDPYVTPVSRGLPRPLLPEEAEAVKAIRDPHGFVCRLGIATGLDWCELTRLQASDFKWVHHREHGRVLVLTMQKRLKTKTLTCQIPVHGNIVGEILIRVGLLVPFSSASSFNKTVRRLSGVEGFQVKRMRHTFASNYLAHGGKIENLRKLMGHTSYATTGINADLMQDAIIEDAYRVFSVASSVAGRL